MQCKYAVFIEPVASLAAYISSLKAEVTQWKPKQKYCDHPPHSTLIFGDYTDSEKWIEELKDAVKCKPFALQVKKWMVFPNDPQANGGQTVTLAIEHSSELSSLQMNCARVLKKYKLSDSEVSQMPLPMATSFREYGFPFVGSHWLPHFSIASLSAAIDDPFLLSITTRQVSFEMIVGSISVWSVQEDEHQKLHVINLNKQ